MIEGAQKYKAQLDKEYSSKIQKYGKVAVEAIYSVGTIPLFKIIDQAHVAEEEHKIAETALVGIKYIEKETIKHHLVEEILRPIEEMIVIARKIIKEKVREELKDYLERIRVTSEDEERARLGAEELRIRLEEKAKEAAEAKESEAKEGEPKVPEEGSEDKKWEPSDEQEE